MSRCLHLVKCTNMLLLQLAVQVFYSYIGYSVVGFKKTKTKQKNTHKKNQSHTQKISPKMVDPTDLAGNAEEKEEEEDRIFAPFSRRWFKVVPIPSPSSLLRY